MPRLFCSQYNISLHLELAHLFTHLIAHQVATLARDRLSSAGLESQLVISVALLPERPSSLLGMCARSCGHVHISTGHTQLSHNSGDKLQRGHLISRCLCRSRGFTTKPPRLHCSKGALRQLVLPLASVPDAVSATSQSAAEDQQQQDVTWAAATMVQNRCHALVTVFSLSK